MDTIVINAEEWKELVYKIDRIAGFIEQYAEQLPAADNAWLNETQVCDYLKISTKSLQRLRKSGDIAFSTVCKKHFYKAGEVKVLMEKKITGSNREHLDRLRNLHRKGFRK
ncbi:MAG: helix-turn-helix domain-containing protein [Dysgonamonadaceae bacterium]|nr:helix-turn-helix domain-containing protein [Dysgonamonadaceae bacterium]